MESRLSPEVLFGRYIRALKEWYKDNEIKRLEPKLKLRNWNLHFFAREGVRNHDYAVWCQKLGRLKSVKSEFGDRMVGQEYLWDLCWAQPEEYIDRDKRDFLALVLEQELNDWVTPFESPREDAWWDFTKILFADVTVMKVFIGRSSKKGFQTIPGKYAEYYEKVCCRENVGLLLILINWKSKVFTIGGWELTKSGEAKQLGSEVTFVHSGTRSKDFL